MPPGHTIFMKKYSYLPEKAHFLQKKKINNHKPEKNGDFDLKKGQKGPKMTFDKKYFFSSSSYGGPVRWSKYLSQTRKKGSS